MTADKPVTVLRDYHSVNLLWREEAQARFRLGLIDVQDALAGHAAYDLASLLCDARLDVDAVHQMQGLDHYMQARFGADAEARADFQAAYALCLMQRNMKIAGIFVRLAERVTKSRATCATCPVCWVILTGRWRMKRSLPWPHGWRDTRPMRWSPSMIETAMILAAGKGTRMRAAPNDPPKPLVELAGESLLARMLARLMAAGVRRIIVNVHHKAEQIEAMLAVFAEAHPSLEIDISDERDALLETGGGVKNALPLLGQPLFGRQCRFAVVGKQPRN